jgi:hypothetical protein
MITAQVQSASRFKNKPASDIDAADFCGTPFEVDSASVECTVLLVHVERAYLGVGELCWYRVDMRY